MKKLLVVLSVLFVVALIAGSAFAAMYDPDQRNAKLQNEKAAVVKIGGEFTFGSITNFTANQSRGGFANEYVDISLWPDDTNSLLIELAGDNLMDSQGLGNLKNTYWEWSSDLGKALDLPVTLKSTAGKTSIYTRKFEVSGLAYERPAVPRLAERPNMDPIPFKVAVGTDQFTVTAGIGFGAGFGLLPSDAEKTRDLGVLIAIPKIGPASAELFYLAEDNADFKGVAGLNVKAVGLANDMLDFAGEFWYDTPTEDWAYGAAVNAKYDKIRGAVSLNGNNNDALNVVGVDAAYAITDIFGLDAALGLGFAEALDTFQGAEFSVYAKVGVSKWNVGYQIKDNTGFNYAPAVANLKGGLFIVCDTNF
jgi:hypothetical protein